LFWSTFSGGNMPSDLISNFFGIFCLLPGRPRVNFSVSQRTHQSKEGFQAEPILGYFDVNLRPKLSHVGIYRGSCPTKVVRRLPSGGGGMERRGGVLQRNPKNVNPPFIKVHPGL